MTVMMRATFFFKDTNGYGWSETIHSNAPDYTSTLAKARTLIDLRTALLGTTSSLVFVRVSDDLIKRDSLVYRVPVGDGTTRSSAAQSSDIANTCLTVRLDGSPTGRRTLYMRGIPDRITVNSGKYAPGGGFDSSFDKWVNQLATDQWAIRVKNPLVTQVPITGITQAPGSPQVVITTVAPHGLTVPGSCTISGVGNNPRLRGNWNIQAVTSNTVTVNVNFLLQPVTLFGTISKIEFQLVSIITGEVTKVGHRITGRPFDSPLGRRKVRGPK